MPRLAPIQFTREARRRRGFTLIEMMVAVGIIIILAAIAMVVGVQVKHHAQERATRTTLTTLEGAMGKYLSDGNAEPPLVAGGIDPSGKSWVQMLTLDPEATKVISSQHLDAVNGQVLDAWGYPILYIPRDFTPGATPLAGTINPGIKAPAKFMSTGPDGPINGQPSTYLFSSGVQ